MRLYHAKEYHGNIQISHRKNLEYYYVIANMMLMMMFSIQMNRTWISFVLENEQKYIMEATVVVVVVHHR